MTKNNSYSFSSKVGTLCPPFFLRHLVLIGVTAFGLSACSEQPASKTEQSSVKVVTADTHIYRDEYGTPHVVSNSNYGVYFGYGYAVATDRLFQMEMLRRTVEGQVAEVLGEEYLELDKHVRTGYDHRAVGRQLEQLKAEDLEVLTAYADGFSRRVKEVLADRNALLPKEFTDFDFLPVSWSADDVAMIFIGSIIHRYSDFNSELDSLGLLNSLNELHGEEKANAIFNASKWLLDPSSPTTVPRKNSIVSSVQVNDVPSSRMQDSFTKNIVLNESGKFVGTTQNPKMRALHEEQVAKNGFTGPQYAAASNFWSVTGNKLSDADGALVNGPQFGFGLPSYVYGIGLHGGDFNVVGNTLLGLPTMLFAHNNKVSWGSTAGMSDQVDVYQEQLVNDKAEHYRHDGQDKAFETWVEKIKVKDSAPVNVTARRSVHGMVVSMDAANGIAYTRARAWEGAEVQTLVSWVNLAKDKTMDTVQSRLGGIAANINFYYMDVDGNLGYTHGGRYPQRSESHDSRVPAAGTGEHDWLGYRPYTDNPNVRNPEQGFIVNWNNRPGAGWIASDLWGQTWSKADRTSHIVDELNSKEVLSTDEVWDIAEKVSYDDVSAVFLMSYLSEGMQGNDFDNSVKAAHKLLADWSGEWRIQEGGSYGPAELLVENWTKNIFKTVLLDDIGEEKFAMYSATNNPSNPLGPSMASSVGVKVILHNLQLLDSDSQPLRGGAQSLSSGALAYDFFNGAKPGDVLSQSFAETVSQLIAQHGDDMSSWSLAPTPMTWKPYNFRGVPQASPDRLASLPVYMNRGSENNFFIARNGSFRAYDVLPPGQSGFVAPDGTLSPHALDQMEMYSKYELKTIPFTTEEIKKVTVSTEALNTKTSVVEKIQSTLNRAEQAKKLNSMIYVDERGALAAAHAADVDDAAAGLLKGVPIVVKDNTHVAGMPNSAGTPALKGFIPSENHPAVQRLVDAGAIVIGKANMHELAFGITSNNAAFGAVRNARDSSRIAGGSSGGSAVAVAAGIVDMALGTDTGGSTRIPPALNGVVGFRPSEGRYPGGSVTPISSTRDTVGPIANNIFNAALLDCVITLCEDELQPAELNGLRLGVPRAYFYDNLSPDVATVTRQTLDKLKAAGVVLVDVDMAGLEAANNGAGFAVALYEFMQEIPEYLKVNNTGVSMQQLADQIASPDVKATVMSQMGDQAIPEAAYRAAMDKFRPELMAIYDRAFKSNNVAALILPTTPLTATPIATSDETVLLNGVKSPTFPTFIRNTDPTSNADLPSLTLPSGVDREGLPIGIMLDGPRNSDRSLFSIGLAIESLLAE